MGIIYITIQLIIKESNTWLMIYISRLGVTMVSMVHTLTRAEMKPTLVILG